MFHKDRRLLASERFGELDADKLCLEKVNPFQAQAQYKTGKYDR